MSTSTNLQTIAPDETDALCAELLDEVLDAPRPSPGFACMVTSGCQAGIGQVDDHR
jgi:hypothetical protein